MNHAKSRADKARRIHALADIRATRKARLLDEARRELDTLTRQRRELGEHARRYQSECLEHTAAHLPSLLGQRREFVARLAEHMSLLERRTHDSAERVRRATAEHARSAAQASAVDALLREATALEAVETTRAEQRRTDELGRGHDRRGVLGSRGERP